ncbi:MAG: hypothetical protein ACREMY_17895 [bacterium]
MSIKRARIGLWFAAGVLAVVLLAAGRAHLLGSTVTVNNQSLTQLMNVRVTMAGTDVWSGALAPGETHKAYGRPSRDGTIGVSFETAGQTIHKEFGYVTPGLGEHHTIVVLPSLEVRYAAR